MNPKVSWFLFKEAVPLAVTNILGILYFRVGTLYLFRYSGAEQTGIFTSASQIVEACAVDSNGYCRSVVSPYLQGRKRTREKWSSVFEQVTSALIFIALFVAAPPQLV